MPDNFKRYTERHQKRKNNLEQKQNVECRETSERESSNIHVYKAFWPFYFRPHTPREDHWKVKQLPRSRWFICLPFTTPPALVVKRYIKISFFTRQKHAEYLFFFNSAFSHGEKALYFLNTETIIIGIFTLVVETWLLVLFGLLFYFLSGFKELQSIPIKKIIFSRYSFYHSYGNTCFQTQSERQCTRKSDKQNCRTKKKSVDKDGTSAKYLRALVCINLFRTVKKQLR